jgi:hypothetical protein
MTDRDLIALGFQPHGDGSLHSPGRVTLTPAGGFVADAFAAFRADKIGVSKIAAGLSDAEWKRLKRAENRRRRESKPS